MYGFCFLFYSVLFELIYDFGNMKLISDLVFVFFYWYMIVEKCLFKNMYGK